MDNSLKSGGFTLLEVLIAMVIIGITSIVMINTFKTTKKMETISSASDEAYALAEAKITSLQVPGNPIKLTKKDTLTTSNKKRYVLEWEIDRNVTPNRIDITVFWGNGSKTESIAVSGFIAAQKICPTINPNSTPTDITLSQTTVSATAAIGATVATITATDSDLARGDLHSFSLVALKDTTFCRDNGKFLIFQDKLLTYATMQANMTYRIAIQTCDCEGAGTIKTFTITGQP
ncbi:MAG: type II secretion system protein [Chitinivibrionales bacterium]|nr:type II secretion system protein [Chitinivibrionales bacterium]